MSSYLAKQAMRNARRCCGGGRVRATRAIARHKKARGQQGDAVQTQKDELCTRFEGEQRESGSGEAAGDMAPAMRCPAAGSWRLGCTSPVDYSLPKPSCHDFGPDAPLERGTQWLQRGNAMQGQCWPCAFIATMPLLLFAQKRDTLSFLPDPDNGNTQ
jgi:hypothetical protein